MRLPNRIEKEIRAIEAEYDARPGQHAGNARLRSLRHAIEDFLKEHGWSYAKEAEAGV